jgi:hypothetical protein
MSLGLAKDGPKKKSILPVDSPNRGFSNGEIENELQQIQDVNLSTTSTPSVTE